MNATVLALRNGVRRGWIELGHTFRNAQDLWGYLFPAVLLTVVTLFMRGATVPGTGFSLGTRTLPSALGMGIAFGSLVNLAQQLIVEREDGTLLRAKATPNGMLGYLVGKITVVSGMLLISLTLQLVPGLFVLDGLAINTVGAWFTLAWVLALGMVATMPLGAIVGSLKRWLSGWRKGASSAKKRKAATAPASSSTSPLPPAAQTKGRRSHVSPS